MRFTTGSHKPFLSFPASLVQSFPQSLKFLFEFFLLFFLTCKEKKCSPCRHSHKVRVTAGLFLTIAALGSQTLKDKQSQ